VVRSSSPRANFCLIHASSQPSICFRSWRGTFATSIYAFGESADEEQLRDREASRQSTSAARSEAFSSFKPDPFRLSLVLVGLAPEAACTLMLWASSLCCTAEFYPRCVAEGYRTLAPGSLVTRRGDANSRSTFHRRR
jgi:hypothetical protein